MLTLKNRRLQTTEPVPPKYITISLGHNIFGRGYKSDVKLCGYPWISRKHLSITRVDSSHFLEVFGKNGVAINGNKVNFKILEEGDIITIGCSATDSPIIQNFGPFIEYTYSYTVSHSADISAASYKDPVFNPNDLICLEDVVNGRTFTETYHAEDFNTTLDSCDITLPSPEDQQQQILAMPVKAGASAASSRPPRKRKPKMDSDMVYNTKPRLSESDPKQQSTELGNRDDVLAESNKANIPTQFQNIVAKPNKAATVKRLRSRASSTVSKPSDELTVKPKKAFASSVSSLKSNQSQKSCPLAPCTSSENDPWREYEKTVEMVNDLMTTMDQKIKSSQAQKAEALATAANNESSCNGESSNSGESSNKAEQPSTSAIDEQNRIPKFKIRSPKPRLSRGPHKQVKYCFPEEDEEEDEFTDRYDDIDEDFVVDNKKAAKKRKLNEDLEEDEYLPDIENIQCETIVTTASTSGSNSKETKKFMEKFDRKEKAKPKKGAKGKKSLSKKSRSVEEQAALGKWMRMPRKPHGRKYVEILNGKFVTTLVEFEDKIIFDVTIKEEEIPQYCLEKNVILKIDVATLKDKLLEGSLSKADKSCLFRLVRKQMKKPKMTEYDKPRILPRDYVTQQPEDVDLKLKQYQVDTLGWMKQLENRVDRGFTTSKLVKWKESGLDLGFDVHHQRVFEMPPPLIKSTVLTVKSKGGILADQMGLGKTITILGLISANRASFSRIPDPQEYNYFECFKLPTAATLIVAPSHLTGQWKDEVEKHTNNMKVILITTKPQYERVTYVDILEADIVIVSVQFLLTNKVFTELPSGVDAETDFMSLMYKPGINPLLKKSPNLMHFNWWRIVADEAHELLTYEEQPNKRSKRNHHAGSPGLQMITAFTSSYRWYVTGTPFPHGEKSLRAALKFLEVSIDDPTMVYADGSLMFDKHDAMYEDYSNEGTYIYPVHNVVLNHLYVRNTKGSIGGDYDVPEFLEELILLSMGEVERGIYERSISDLERRQLCCHLQIADRIQRVAGAQQKTIEEVRVALVEQTRKDIEHTERSITRFKDDIVKEREEKRKAETDTLRSMHEKRIKVMLDCVKKEEQELEKHRSALAYFNSIVPRINHSADEPCVICLESIERLTVTPCGHLYCRKCIIQCLNQNGQCPTCRKHVNQSQLLEVRDAQSRDELQKSAELTRLTEKYGTKMAYLIFYLRNLFSANQDCRVIIFSQWDTLMAKIGETLNENNINSVFVKGNVHVRNKAIMSFRKQEKTRVIMLSLQNAASGTNLVEATHVILIDPVAGSKEEAIAIESQAIGRAHRMGQFKQISVVRMIMKDTIEHALYLRNNEDDNIQQVEFNFEKSNAFGGPQIVKRERKVPEPDPTILQRALKWQEEEQTRYQLTHGAGSSRGGRRGRRPDLFLMSEVSDLMSRLHDDGDDGELPYDWEEDSEGSDVDNYYYTDDGHGYNRQRHDCVIS